MPPKLSRRWFCATSATAGLAFLGPISLAAANRTRADEVVGSVGRFFPTTDPSLSQAVVGASHVRFDEVRELLKEDRSLALASWDWGFGDWESALGAASHMGQHGIAELLMEHGARPNVFTFAMLDHVDSVKAICEATPGIQRNRGPHGITLLAHAQHGKAARVEEFLSALGGADEREAMIEYNPERRGTYVGEYLFEEGETDRLHVELTRGEGIGILRTGGTSRRLHNTGEHQFSPSGAPHVTIRFKVDGERATALTIERGAPILTALRVEG